MVSLVPPVGLEPTHWALLGGRPLPLGYEGKVKFGQIPPRRAFLGEKLTQSFWRTASKSRQSCFETEI